MRDEHSKEADMNTMIKKAAAGAALIAAIALAATPSQARWSRGEAAAGRFRGRRGGWRGGDQLVLRPALLRRVRLWVRLLRRRGYAYEPAYSEPVYSEPVYACPRSALLGDDRRRSWLWLLRRMHAVQGNARVAPEQDA